MRRLLLGAVASILGLVWTSLHAIPQASALSLTPSIVDVRVQPGEVKTVTIHVTNDEHQPLTLSASIQKFIPLGTDGRQQFLPPSDLSGLPSWTFVGVKDRILQPGETRNVPIEIRVPSDAVEGGMYQALFFSAHPTRVDPISLGIRARIGALMLVTIGNPQLTELIVEEWQLEGQKRRTMLQGSVRLRLRNGGRIHTVPQGELVIRDMFGNEVDRLPINSSGARLFPSAERDFQIDFGIKQGKRKQSSLGEELGSFGFGRYTITLEGISELRNVPDALSFTVVPWRLLALLVGIGGAISIFFFLYRRRLIRSFHVPRT